MSTKLFFQNIFKIGALLKFIMCEAAIEVAVADKLVELLALP